MIPIESPFHPDNEVAYQRWRSQKLSAYPLHGDTLIVQVQNPAHLSDVEYSALWQRIAKTNMAVYATPLGEREDKSVLQKLMAQFGLARPDANWLADEDGISSLTPRDENGEKRGEFIPYTHHRIRWHTDGYYNPPQRRIFAMGLHCVRQADRGGENDLYDHDLAYIALRDLDSNHIRALMAEDAMTIPARTDELGIAREEETGPALLEEKGLLHLRYTARTKSILWKQDQATQAALASLETLLANKPMGAFTLRLEPGMGVICNNVLHTRACFEDHPGHRRLLYRARYHEHLANLRERG